MSLNKAFQWIFKGYALIFLDFHLFSIDVIPDIIGYHLIAKGWRDLCDSGLTGLPQQRQRSTYFLARLFLVDSLLEQIWTTLDGGFFGIGNIWDVTVPETPPLFRFQPTAIASILLFLAGIWMMFQILTASRNIAEGEGKATVVRGLDRSIELLKKVYIPIGVGIVIMEQCMNPPELWWGNVIRGVQDLGALMYLCFQLMLVLQIVNLRKNLDCCQEMEAAE
ncbi:MAG: hypothetical protein IJ486_09345 [Firmicutes bacterium]|nr:hypothetical protein [Bacillota bacterium]